MKTKNLFYSFLFLIAIAIVPVSCTKDTSNFSSADVQATEDDALSDATYDDIMTIADEYGDNIPTKSGFVANAIADTCFTVSYNSYADSTVVTIDFGDGCTDLWGRTRTGKIVVTVTGERFVEGWGKTIRLVDFHVNDVLVEGTKTVTFLGYNDSQKPYFSVVLSGGRLTTTTGIVIERSFERERVWEEGSDTHYVWDDVWSITGSAQGTTYNGKHYTNTIMTALRLEATCRFIVSGTISCVVDGKDPVILDYGTGTCDELATITRNGETKEIKLRNKRGRN